MTLVFQRTPEQRADLNRLLEQQQNPSSPNYHNWLTPEEFGERFGASADTLNRMAAWLRTEGFTVERTARGRGWIEFSGTAGQVRNAFRTEIHRYRAGSKDHFAPASAPFLSAELAGLIVGIRGLDDFYLEPSAHFEPMFTASDGTHYLTPGDIFTIYDVYPFGGGGQTIAVVGASSIDLADIRQFRSAFQGRPSDPQVLLAGDDPGIDQNAVFEADADLEWAGAIAPGATLLYAYATDVVVAAQYVIDQNLARILSFSFGQCESNISQADAVSIQDLAQQANAQGITWVVASGDGGAAACDQGSYPATHGLAVSFPASLPEVTAVGGTEFNELGSNYWGGNNPLNPASALSYIPEVAWNGTSKSQGLFASGGGASALYAKPSWQSAPGVPDDGARDVPDVALSASLAHDPYIVISGGKTYSAGGTSLSAPVFAGIVGAWTAPSGVGNVNPWLYALAGQNYANFFHDIVTGGNLVPCAAGTQDCSNGALGYSAGPGYDLVTGLGSVDFLRMPQLSDLTTTILSASSAQVSEGQPVTLTATVTSFGGPIPTGQVDFFQDTGAFPGTSEGTRDLDATGRATVTVLLPPGAYAIRARYTTYNLTLPFVFSESTSAPVTMVVVPAPPLAPTLVSPASSAADASVSVSLNWNKSAFASSYDVYFGTTASPPFWGNVTGTQCFPGALMTNTKYYWRVAARDDSGATPSEIWSFTTAGTTYTISTIAGSDNSGFSPDGTPAAAALLSGPSDLAFDSKGDLYIVETGNNRVRMINPAGILSTVAGGGTGGDGGPAISAQLSNPLGIALDGQGNLYISDGYYDNRSRVRKVSPAGIITTFAGGSASGYSGDGGPATSAQLNRPAGLAVDSQGNLYISDTANGCIRKVEAGVITTFAGKCAALDSSGSPIGDGGSATDALLDGPEGVAVDAAGNLDIADTGNCRIRKVSNGIITTLLGDSNIGLGCGPGSYNLPNGNWLQPFGLALDNSGTLYFTSGFTSSYWGIDAGYVVKLAGGSPTLISGGGLFAPGDGGPGTSAIARASGGLAVDARGRIYFVESVFSYVGQNAPSLSQRIRMLTPANAYIPSGPSIAPNGVVNGATFSGGPLSPGSIASAFGTFGFGSDAQSSGGSVPAALAGVSLQFQSGSGPAFAAPLFFASAHSGQVNFQVPWELAGASSATMRGVLNGVAGPSQAVSLAPYSPGIFTVSSNGQGAVVDLGGQLVDSNNPASAGSVIQIFCTGLGPVTNAPSTASGALSAPLSKTIATPIVTIGGIQAQVSFSGLAPGTVGEYQVNAQAPQGVTPGPSVPLALSIGGVNSNIVRIAVR
jgi:uncharacterized protein (TIGR03437 family)